MKVGDFEYGFPDGQYAANGVDPSTALDLAECYSLGSDPKPIIDRIADPQVRASAQRIADRLTEHSARGKK